MLDTPSISSHTLTLSSLRVIGRLGGDMEKCLGTNAWWGGGAAGGKNEMYITIFKFHFKKNADTQRPEGQYTSGLKGNKNTGFFFFALFPKFSVIW